MTEIPKDIQAEEALLSSIILSRAALELAARAVTSTDFYKPGHAALYSVILGLYEAGQPTTDARVIAARLDDLGSLESVGGEKEIARLVTAAPLPRNAAAYAARVVEMANRRKIMQIAYDATNAVSEGVAAADVADEIGTALAGLATADLDAEVDDLITFEQWMQHSTDNPANWVIPGVMRVGWRMILTAPEGVGKATLMRQIAYASSLGVHPFTFGRIPPITTLLVDLENPVDTVAETGKRMVKLAAKYLGEGEPLPQPCWVWSQESGINLRSRRDQTELERRVAACRPQLVCLGPIYKSFTKDSRMNADEITEDLLRVFDDLRTRYKFALILEHHSPRGSEELVPFGSSVFNRWPEFGSYLKPIDGDNRNLQFGQWRPGRATVTWPTSFVWAADWPFKAVYNDDDARY